MSGDLQFLVDQNLPAALVGELHGAVAHASQFGSRPSDSELWQIAKSQGWAIITRDTDFFNRLQVYGSPPKVVWIRFGNLRIRNLREALVAVWPTVLQRIVQYDLIAVYSDRLECFTFSSEE